MAELYTPAQVNALLGEMTAGEVWRISEAGKGTEGTRLTFVALHNAAQRSGLINGVSLEAFLDRIRIADLGGITEGKVAGPLSSDGEPAGQVSPGSADTGD